MAEKRYRSTVTGAERVSSGELRAPWELVEEEPKAKKAKAKKEEAEEAEEVGEADG